MKKNLLVAGLLFGSLFSANAQEVFSENFDGPIPDLEFTVGDYDGDGQMFGIYTTSERILAAGFSAGSVAGSRNFTINSSNELVPADAADNGITSPAITLPAGPSYLSFRVGSLSALQEETGTSHYSVYALTEADYEGITTAAQFLAMIDAKTPILTGNTTADASSVVTADLTSLAGQPIEILFRHHDNAESNGYAYFFMDDVLVASGIAGTNDVLASDFSVYPNPATDVINVSNAKGLVNAVSIVDINGRSVKNVKFAAVSNAQINISDLSSGVYMMSVSSDRGTLVKKIVKN